MKDVQTVFDEFVRLNNIRKISRFGLRYINEIELKEKKPLEWTKYLNNNLLGMINFSIDLKKILGRAMGQLYFKENFGDVLFQFGIWNKDFPGEVTLKEFILDFDSFTRLPINLEQISISELTKKFNEYIEIIFEASITQSFRNLLNH